MASSYFYLSGIAKWVKAKKPDPKYQNYTMSLYVDKETRKTIKDAGMTSRFNEDDDGIFITLRRPHSKKIKDQLVEFGPPLVIDSKGEEFSGFVGNGSKVTAKVVVYDARESKGSRWEALRIDELVEYNPPKDEGNASSVMGTPF